MEKKPKGFLFRGKGGLLNVAVAVDMYGNTITFRYHIPEDNDFHSNPSVALLAHCIGMTYQLPGTGRGKPYVLAQVTDAEMAKCEF